MYTTPEALGCCLSRSRSSGTARLLEICCGAPRTAPEPTAPGVAAPLVTPAHRLVDQLEAEARRELGPLGPALENLFVEVRAQLGAAERDDVALGVALDQIEDLLEARLRW